MKKFLIAVIVIAPLMGTAQISCPAFGKMAPDQQFELMLTWNTLQPYVGLGGFNLSEDHFPVTGEYTDQWMAPGAIFKFYIDDITAVRLKAIYQYRDVEYHSYVADTLGDFSQFDDVYKQTSFKVAPGFQWHYIVERFAFFGGFEAPFTLYETLDRTTFSLDSSTVLATRNESDQTQEIPGGYSVGLGFFGGSTFYYRHTFGIGFEIAAAYQYSTFTGEIKTTTSSTATNGIVITTEQQTLSHYRFTPVEGTLCLSLRF